MVWSDLTCCFAASAPGIQVIETSRYVLLFDGRLDNETDLRGRMPIDQERPANLLGSDPGGTAETVLRVFCHLGPSCLDALVGDLAAVVYDKRRRHLTVLRDITGMRPAYLGSDTQHDWAFGSLLDGLAVLPAVTPDPLWVASSFVGGQLEATSTPYAEVMAVEAGCAAVTSGRGWRQQQQAIWYPTQLSGRGPGIWFEAFRETLDEAVRCRSRGLGRAGVALSGGVDSASLIASSSAVAPSVDWYALCLPFTDSLGDERELQSRIASHVGASLHWVGMQGHGPFGRGEPEEVYARFGAPPATVNWFMQDCLAEKARDLGLDVVSAGEDADSALGGVALTHTSDLLAHGRLVEWRREVAWLRYHRIRGYKGALRHDLQMLTPPMVRRRLPSVFGQHQAPVELSAQLVSQTDLVGRLSSAWSASAWSFGRSFALSQSAVTRPAFIQVFGEDIARPWRDHGVTLSLPYLDRRVLSLTMAMPAEAVVHRGINKIALRESQVGRLSAEFRAQRTKAVLSQASHVALAGPQREALRRGLDAARSLPEWFNPVQVELARQAAADGEHYSVAANLGRMALWIQWVKS